MSDSDPQLVRLADYEPPAWLVPEVELAFDLDLDATEVHARLTIARGSAPEQPLVLDGEDLELLEVRLDGRRLDPSEYQETATSLTIAGVTDGSVLETRVRIRPGENTRLEGLYLSGASESGLLLTQCEAEGFRRITWFADRPDVASRFTVTLRADRARFPVLLAGGNPVDSGDLDDGRHYASFADPHPRPSYLFALVAGDLACLHRDFVTTEGRQVTVNLWAQPESIGQCRFALEAVSAAMRWDEEAYGCSYDLDVFHVVAAQDFNMGAMENKGLNIFNARNLLADAETATDIDHHLVEAVIGHEYFHNWSGNRVTLRDWFQLSLKEGLTVYREQSFAAERSSRALQRISDVKRLWRTQFPEDAGPLAHPVRPEEYCEIGNFYTATVYEKGAELIRMMAGRLGEATFRRGVAAYFTRHDGHGATVEQFLAELGKAAGLELSPYLDWYRQAGTPTVTARGRWDPASHRYHLRLQQHTAPTPGQPDKRPLPIPLAMALFGQNGSQLPLHASNLADGDIQCVVEFDQTETELAFEHVAEQPVLSLARGFSAPVRLDDGSDAADLAILLRHDSDGFNRWHSGHRLAVEAFHACMAGNSEARACRIWCDALAELLVESDRVDQALLAQLLTVPDEVALGHACTVLDPEAVHAARETLCKLLAHAVGVEQLVGRYRKLCRPQSIAMDAEIGARRALGNCLLGQLAAIAPEQAASLATKQFADAANMTDRIGALACLLRLDASQVADCVAAFRRRHANQALAIDKWLAAEATVPKHGTVERVADWKADPLFSLRNPNRVQALIGNFIRANPLAFHRADHAGYHLAVDAILAADRLNPQLAARLATAFDEWRRLEPARRDALRDILRDMTSNHALSAPLGDILARILAENRAPDADPQRPRRQLVDHVLRAPCACLIAG